MTKKKLIFTHEINPSYMAHIQAILPEWELIMGRDISSWEPHIKGTEIIAGWKNDFESSFLNQE